MCYRDGYGCFAFWIGFWCKASNHCIAFQLKSTSLSMYFSFSSITCSFLTALLTTRTSQTNGVLLLSPTIWQW
ncbi:hypothetical protein BJ742DRAFT_535550 [Cladochytrium replicatum]|nr:hypothetical protein BJ742DRAFT_535550 [Cladochytrium replicatum]